MPKFKTTEQVFHDDLPMLFDKNWFSEREEQFPPTIPWTGDRDPNIDDIAIWEVITESGGPFGVYAAWMPYAEHYIAVHRGVVVFETKGWNANQRMEKYLQSMGIFYPKSKDEAPPDYEPRKLILT